MADSLFLSVHIKRGSVVVFLFFYVENKWLLQNVGINNLGNGVSRRSDGDALIILRRCCLNMGENNNGQRGEMEWNKGGWTVVAVVFAAPQLDKCRAI